VRLEETYGPVEGKRVWQMGYNYEFWCMICLKHQT